MVSSMLQQLLPEALFIQIGLCLTLVTAILFIVDITSVTNAFSRLTLGPSSVNQQWVIDNVLQLALDTTYECKLITENYDC
jgi:hypothetical protein